MLLLDTEEGKDKDHVIARHGGEEGDRSHVIQPGSVAVWFLVCVFCAGGGGCSVWAAAEAPPRSPTP